VKSHSGGSSSTAPRDAAAKTRPRGTAAGARVRHDPSVAGMLREVRNGDLDLFFGFRTDPDAIWMAAEPDDPTDRAAFDAVWRTMRTEPSITTRTIESRGQVVGYIVSWKHSSQREVEFWIGREHWGKGIATAALAEFLELEPERPLYAVAAQDNLGAVRVLEKFGFQVVQEGTNLMAARDEPVRISLLAVGLSD
jgi:RimJ/RimL family protein N-acetyltransferase